MLILLETLDGIRNIVNAPEVEPHALVIMRPMFHGTGRPTEDRLEYRRYERYSEEAGVPVFREADS